MNAQLEQWKREAAALRQELLQALEEGTAEQRNRLFSRLTPEDFSEGRYREVFSRWHDEWLALRSLDYWEEEHSSESPSVTKDQVHEAMIERLVRLEGAIRLAEVMVKAASALGQNLASYDQALEDLSVEVSGRLRRLGMLRASPEVWEDSRTRIRRSLGQIEARACQEEVVAESDLGWSGIREIDLAVGPLRPGRLYLVGARPGEGKTAFLGMLARTYAIESRRCGFLSLRDSADAIAIRLLNSEGRLTQQSILDGWIFGEANSAYDFMIALQSMVESFPAVAEAPDAGPGALREFARSLVAVKRLEILLVDDLGFAPQAWNLTTRDTCLLHRIAAFRQVAAEMRIPVVASVNLGPGDEMAGACPASAELLRLSSADFLAVLVALRSADGDAIHQFDILQNPFGPPTRLPLVYNRRHHRFFTLATDHVDQ